MKVLSHKFQLAAVASVMVAGLCGNAQAALDLSGASYVVYGDAQSYALQVDGAQVGLSGPGSKFYVDSTAGAIKDLVVVATGSSGTGVTTNVDGMDGAMSSVSGTGSTSNFFAGIWNSTLAAFTGFLAGDTPIFFFNNNQVKSGAATNENVAVWAQVSLTGKDAEGNALKTVYFDFTNNGGKYALFTEGGGGVYSGFGGNVASYDSSGAGPLAGTNDKTDYVKSGGAICLTTTDTTSSGGYAIGTPISCTSTLPHSKAIDNNLGANQAAYAIVAPELNDWLADWLKGNYVGYTDLHVDLRYGCDPRTVDSSYDTGSCIGRDSNNGYEQLFIGTATTVTVPEPGMLSLLALGLVGLGVASRRRKI